MATKRSLPVRKSRKLELRSPQLRNNMLALLEKVRDDERAREAFVNNPTKAIASKVTLATATPRQVSESNRLLFALLANDRMREFMARFEPRGSNATTSKQEFATAFAKEVASLNDDNIVVALVGNALVGNGIPGLSNLAYQCVSNETTGKSSCACTPVAKNQARFGENAIDPATIRALSEALTARAKALVRQGVIANLDETIG